MQEQGMLAVTYPCYVMFQPSFSFDDKTQRLAVRDHLNFTARLEKPRAFLLVFRDLNAIAQFLQDFPECTGSSVLAVPTPNLLRQIVLDIKSRRGGPIDLCIDFSKSFNGWRISFDNMLSSQDRADPSLNRKT